MQACDEAGFTDGPPPSSGTAPLGSVVPLDADVRAAVTAALRRAYAPTAAMAGVAAGDSTADAADAATSDTAAADAPHPPPSSTSAAAAASAADFEAAARAVSTGDLDGAASLLRRAAAACPPTRMRAAARIARYLAAVEDRIQRRERERAADDVDNA